MKKKKNQNNLMAILVIGLIAIIALQTIQIFFMGQSRTTRTPTGMASGGMMGGAQEFGSESNDATGVSQLEMMAAHHGSGSQQFSSQEEMMEAHHGSGAAGAGGCGGH